MNFIFELLLSFCYFRYFQFAIFFLLYRQEFVCTKTSVKAGNGVIDILTSEHIENTKLESRM